MFKGFKFEVPKPKELTDASQKELSELTFQFSRISANEGSRLESFQSHRSPLANRSRSETQEKRRLEALEFQKKQRSITISKARQLALGTPTEEEVDEGDDEQEDEEEEEHGYYPKHKRARDSDDEMEEYFLHGSLSIFNRISDQIMYAENLEGIPSDFIENWVMMICPKGKRCLVTSGSGETIARSRAGNIIGRFQSMIPNGSSSNRTSDFCILDCVYDAVHWTFYVLDIMCWRGYPIFDCDTNFRHFWLQTKIEPSELDRPNNDNKFYQFKSVTPILTSETQVVAKDPEGFLAKQGHHYEIDGLLFYHRQTNYRGGSTPLVCWVSRQDVPTLLNHE
ncbi:uncharacterized protein EV154DRAFT_479501 [Mucor mucedo]|uniref:uncharacterized protein n=1 Tax=Mucor mucedo TaxID=29922 RepID=UPI00221F266A|nr:uncharacterized protein EV154DRAFT_479501 [Mucor mucedo]KAI7893273.1 hypothetical protein EV154DRAFT_479501 [Mucor mucedo]